MFGVLLLWATALFVAASAAYFSVFGLMSIFPSTPVSAMILGSVLEAGKIVGVSFLYNYYKVASKVLVTIMAILLLGLILFTSKGIFDYFSASYTTDSLPLEQVRVELSLVQSNMDTDLARKADIDAQIAAIPADYVTAKQRLIATFKEEYTAIEARIRENSDSLLRLNNQLQENRASVGSISLLSEQLGITNDKAIFYTIVFIVLLIDPFAVCLTIAANTATRKRREQLEKDAMTEPVAAAESSVVAQQEAPIAEVPDEIMRWVNRHKINSDVKLAAIN